MSMNLVGGLGLVLLLIVVILFSIVFWTTYRPVSIVLAVAAALVTIGIARRMWQG